MSDLVLPTSGSRQSSWRHPFVYLNSKFRLAAFRDSTWIFIRSTGGSASDESGRELKRESIRSANRRESKRYFPRRTQHGRLVSRSAISQNGRQSRSYSPDHHARTPTTFVRAGALLTGLHDIVAQGGRPRFKHDLPQLVERSSIPFPRLYQMLPTDAKASTRSISTMQASGRTTAWAREKISLQKCRECKGVLRRRIGSNDLMQASTKKQSWSTDSKTANSYSRIVEGDGTVPSNSRNLDASRTYFVDEAHGSCRAIAPSSRRDRLTQ